MRDFTKLGISLRGHTSGTLKTFCPFCRERRSNKRDRSLRVDIDKGFYKCYYCEAKGYVPDEEEERRREARRLKREEKLSRPPQNTGFVRPEWHPEMTVSPLDAGEHQSADSGEHQPADAGRRELVDYMTCRRGITADTLHKAKVAVCRTMLFGTGGQGGGSAVPAIAFNYFDRGVLINVKYRTLDKNFRFVPKAELIPYNIDAIAHSEVCYITEGEFDALTLMQCGFPETVSVPNGAQQNLSFLDRFVETHFEDKTRIVLALDNDTKGDMLRDELTRRLGEERCRIVEWSEGCKDANDELMANGAASVEARVKGAVEIPVTGISTIDDVEQDADALFVNGKQHGAGLMLGSLDKQITFETGRFMVVTGRPGDGKSEFVDEICLRLALIHDWKIAYFSPENTPVTYHLAKLSEKLTGYPFRQKGRMTRGLYDGFKKWAAANVCHIQPGGDGEAYGTEHDTGRSAAEEERSERNTLPAILGKMRRAVARRGVRVAVIDPLNNIDPEKGMTELEWDKHVCRELRRFAGKYRCLMILVAHPRKVNRSTLDGRKRRVEMNDINGSADFGNMSDFCLCIDRDDDLKVVTVYVDKVKFKHLGSRGGVTMHYDELSGRYVPCILERVPAGAGAADGTVAGKPSATVVSDASGTKFYKTVDWRNFNIRWIDEQGNAILASQMERDAGQQASLFT